MIRNAIALVLLGAMVAGLGPAAFAQSARPREDGMRQDPRLRSGWIRVELAVLIDDRSEVLETEAWPPYPTPRYPTSFRWLLDPDRLVDIDTRYPRANATQDAAGRITVEVPDVQPQLDELEAAANVEAMLEAEADSEPEPIPLELIDTLPEETRASVDWLDDFEEETPEGPMDDLVAPQAEDDPGPPPLPRAFQKRPVTLLKDGLNRLQRNTSDRVQLSTAWLQPPGAANLPIVLDYSGDTEFWPPLQGFVELRRGNEVRMGINLWWNTEAEYLPEGFRMAAPPRAPAQVTLVDPVNGRLLTPLEVAERQAAMIRLEQERPEMPGDVAYVDPETGLLVLETGDDADGDPDAWPWGHLLHIEDTRSVPRGSVRYYDHPVIKVVATWEELRWGEVYEVGELDRAREAAVQGQDLPPAR